MNCTRAVPGCRRISAAKPALRARAAVKGTDMSSATTATPRPRAAAGEPSVEPLST